MREAQERSKFMRHWTRMEGQTGDSQEGRDSNLYAMLTNKGESMREDITNEELDTLANDTECEECGHGQLFHHYAGGIHKCLVNNCECWG